MRSIKLFMVAVFVMTLFATLVGAAELDQNYQKAMSRYFRVSEDAVADIAAKGLPVEELPVVFHVAERTGMPATSIAETRTQGHSWMAIINVRGMKAGDFYVIANGDFQSKTFSPILARFNSTPRNQWGDLQLSDSDIVNLVNLKFISSAHDYSLFEAMELCDGGQDFVHVNQEISQRKTEYLASRDTSPELLKAGVGAH